MADHHSTSTPKHDDDVSLDKKKLIYIGARRYKSSGCAMRTLNRFRKEGGSGFCDVILQVEGRHYPVHRCVLAANSPFFYTMFNSGMKESMQQTLQLQSIKAKAMESILEFFYTQEIVLEEDELLDLLDAASFLLLPALTDAIIELLSSILSVDNCFSIRMIASKYNAKDLLSNADGFIKGNFVYLSLWSNEFIYLPCEEICNVISGDDIHIEDEIQALSAVLRWLEHDLSERVQHLSKLLKEVRLHVISGAAVNELVTNRPKLTENPSAKSMVKKNIARALSEQEEATADKSTQIPRPSTVLHNTLVGVGIGECRKVFCYDVEDKETYVLPDLPQVQAFPCLVSMDTDVYILGGESQKNINYDPVNSMRIFSFQVMKNSTERRVGWRKMASFREVRRDTAVTTHDKKIYVLGGWMSGPTGTVECYDLLSANWISVASLNVPRSQLAAVASDSRIFAVGGSVDQVVGTNTVEYLDPVINSWSFLPPMKTRRIFANVSFLRNKLYVLGGYANVFERISSCEMFDLDKNKWFDIASLPDNLPTNQSTVTLNGEIIAVVGAQDSCCSAAWYNPHSDVWEKVQNFDVYGNIAGYRLCCLQVKKYYLQHLPHADSESRDWPIKQDLYYEDNSFVSVNAGDLGLSLSGDDQETNSEEEYFFL
ncbi:predicted protein [Nematostella vectensis]|uniref:BTB domain-containing protein n=1 Tax=Nematostella vectensis TaxID=45351 RepID=A7RZR4_NEMVE|nr:predicted protein [Nematostella vectensis]|eukprot:XP_001635055.1 predicted protein [Nematostella vectensis]